MLKGRESAPEGGVGDPEKFPAGAKSALDEKRGSQHQAEDRNTC